MGAVPFHAVLPEADCLGNATHGAEAIWLAASGWQVTAVDFSVTALDLARTTSQAFGADVAERIEWVEGDLGSWTPTSRHFDLVSCIHGRPRGRYR
jgi:2-polyprenyl-3-methyl-5-hydroxy-6-metoxy-1,4-benzoquinol methylase